jgi:hypothetical protein
MPRKQIVQVSQVRCLPERDAGRGRIDGRETAKNLGAAGMASARAYNRPTKVNASIIKSVVARITEAGRDCLSTKRCDLPSAHSKGLNQVVTHTMVMFGGDAVLALDLRSFATLCDFVTNVIEGRMATGALKG